MNTTHNTDKLGKSDRDRILGQALTRAIAEKTKNQPCPPLEDIAALVDGRLEDKRRDDVMGHLAGCDTCYHVFLSTSEMVNAVAKRGKKQVYIVSGLAAAAVLLVALSMVLRQSGTESQTVAKRVETIAPIPGKRATDEIRNKPAVMAHAPQKQKKFVPMTAGGMGEMVAQGVDTERLQGLIGEGDRRTYGFADARDSSSQAFRLGIASVDLELSLLKDDRESALRQISKLLRILNSFEKIQFPVAALEQVRDRLEGDTSPNKVQGVTGIIRNGLPKDLRIYLDFGMWSEAARIAAATGNAAFFRGDALAYFRKNLPRNKGTMDTLKALEAMEPLTKVKEITPQDFALLEKSIDKIINY